MPLLLPTAMLAVGIVCGMSQWWLWIVVLTAISALVLIFTRFKLIALAFAFCAAGALNSHFRIPSSPPFTTPGTSQIYQGTITRAKIGDTSQTLTVHVTHSGIDSLQIYEIQPFDATLTIPSFDIEHESMYDISFCAELIPVTSQHDIPRSEERR